MLFWLNGVAWSSILPRYPEIKESLRLDDQWWGIAVAIGPVGGLVAGLVTAALIRRYSSAWVSVVSQVVGIAILNLIGNAPAAWVFAVGVFLMASLDTLTDISMNAHGLRVQELYGRPILNSWARRPCCSPAWTTTRRLRGAGKSDDGVCLPVLSRDSRRSGCSAPRLG